MRSLRDRSRVIPVLVLLLLPAAVFAQSTATSTTDRLFLNFAEDATRVDNQWWEGQIEYDEGDSVDLALIRGVVAFQPLPDLEIGGRVGFGNSDGPAGLPDGTGATDLDAWAKYYFNPGGGTNEFAAGVLVTVPTGDDTAGLGNDAFGIAAFGALRHRLDRLVLTGNVGVRLNGDGQIFGLPERDGEVSASIGLGVFVPWTDQVTFVGELDFETERFDGGDEDARVLAGVNWRVGNRGLVRPALAIGLSDGAPDAQIVIGYAYNF